MSIRKKLGIDYGDVNPITTREDRIQYINLKLASLGLPIYRSDDNQTEANTYFIDLFEDIIKDYKEKKRMVDVNEVGIYKRINSFFDSYFSESGYPPKVVDDSLTLDHYGLAREMSLPPDGNTFSNEYINSYRIKQGVLQNPKNDRRTTEGSFHIVEGGLAIPYDKKAVPKEAFLKLYEAAANPAGGAEASALYHQAGGACQDICLSDDQNPSYPHGYREFWKKRGWRFSLWRQEVLFQIWTLLNPFSEIWVIRVFTTMTRA